MIAWRQGMSDQAADLMVVLTRDLSLSKDAAKCLISHGQVSIDGYTIGMQHVRRWKVRQLRGRMLKAGRIEVRLYTAGGRTERLQQEMAV